MTTASAVGTKIRIATAASAIAAAATIAPAAVAHASPAAPLAEAGFGSALGVVDVTPCDPNVQVCAAGVGDSSATVFQSPFFWFGPANPNFQPLIGIVFPNIFGLNFELCLLGGAIHLSPYSGGFIGLGAGC
ncbi:hypothetical protein ABGB19_22050 [Mycobacterium sp. B14F4]|uniref:hypothetical protein n=1 Tax=Mycobacterium sp. B14F4 TaxID=3153565 RepID=UPI00325C42B1